MQVRSEPVSRFFSTFLRITQNVLADTDAADFEAMVIQAHEKSVVQVQGIPVGLPHAQAVREVLSQMDLTEWPVFVAFRAHSEVGRLYVGEVARDELYFAAIDTLGPGVQVRACGIPPYWDSETAIR